MRINLASAGSLDNVRSLLAQSPIGIDTLKGNLDKISIEGDGALDLELIVPLRNWQTFEFTSNVQTEDAILRMQGFPAPLTNLNGAFSIGRDDISSDELTGTLLGGEVDIDLRPAPESMPGYRIIATGKGTATAEALINELNVPLEDALQGATDFEARLLFARGQEEIRSPFRSR